jgi:signal-transduction protein with cAMP-binding, CBS, and nucleotidyltransferase domain
MKVRDLVLRQPVMVDAATPITAAAARMGSDGVGSLIVTDGGRPVGVVTDRDIVVRGVARGVPSDARIDSLMSMGVTSVSGDADVSELVHVFGTHAVRRVPVVDGDEVIGLVSLDDMMIQLTTQLGDLTRGLTAQVLFPHAGDEAPPPAGR